MPDRARKVRAIGCVLKGSRIRLRWKQGKAEDGRSETGQGRLKTGLDVTEAEGWGRMRPVEVGNIAGEEG